MKKKHEKPELKVLFDTNIIYSGSANYLLNEQVSNFIKKNNSFFDLLVSWHIPEIVINERKFQMISKGLELLAPIEKLEKLLGHNLNITKEIIESRVHETIFKQINDFCLKITKIDTKDIDWDSIINNSVFRLPPFENNSKEKGFRDSIIVETFYQLIKNSPKTYKTCRIVLVCNDILLTEAAKLKAKSYNNIRFVKDLSELKSLINILVSEIEESIVDKIAENANQIFFIPEDESTFYFTEKITEKITEKFYQKLHELPDNNAFITKSNTWYVSDVNFVKKERQKIYWRTAISAELISYKREVKNDFNENSINDLLLKKNFSKEALPILKLPNSSGIKRMFGSSTKFFVEEIEYMRGKSMYEVIWSVTYRTNHNLSNPKVEEINFIENNWNNNEHDS